MLLFNPCLRFIRLTGALTVVDPSVEKNSQADGGQDSEQDGGVSSKEEEVEVGRRLLVMILLGHTVSQMLEVWMIGELSGQKASCCPAISPARRENLSDLQVF